MALKSLLSAKLYENKLIFVNEEFIPHPKTTYLSAVIEPFKSERLLMLTPFEADENFSRAQQRIANINTANP